MMRITTGIYKGRNLIMPFGIRPTQNITRKAVFDIIGDIAGLTFLELYAGSGAVGLEAASRGAKGVVFVEKNGACVKAVNDNIKLLQGEKASGPWFKDYLVIQADANEAIKQLSRQKKAFDIIFFDPPYSKGDDGDSLAKKTLQTLCTYDILPPSGLIIAQYPKKESLPEHLGALTLLKLSAYGDTKLSFYQKKAA